jgi:AmiR/NasT family two-component response regulator
MGRRVLIAEDEIVSAMALEKMLAELGHQVIGIVTAGEEAIELAIRESPDLVVMDIRLAGKMDGIDAAARIVEKSGAGIVFMTGYDDEGTLARATAMNPLGILNKPISKSGFKNLLE